jgi:6,7-dimethyl-8-ribityllumazine synthase
VKRDGAASAPAPDCAGRRFALVVARFHAELGDMLLDGARRALRRCNVADEDVTLLDVPGCFEIPLACRNAIETQRFDALVALGAVVRGETPHFEYVAGECARGIMDVQLATGTPIGFGILTTDNLQQARERASPDGGDKGYSAAIAAATLLSLDAAQPRAGFRRN